MRSSLPRYGGSRRVPLPAARPAFFPRAAYLQVKAISNPGADYRDRLVAGFRQNIHAAHVLLGPGASTARLVGVLVPKEWAWIPPGACANAIGYWHAPGTVDDPNPGLGAFGPPGRC